MTATPETDVFNVLLRERSQAMSEVDAAAGRLAEARARLGAIDQALSSLESAGLVTLPDGVNLTHTASTSGTRSRRGASINAVLAALPADGTALTEDEVFARIDPFSELHRAQWPTKAARRALCRLIDKGLVEKTGQSFRRRNVPPGQNA